jgi:hypothetical protein
LTLRWRRAGAWSCTTRRGGPARAPSPNIAIPFCEPSGQRCNRSPIEACLYAIEVKAKATARDVRHAIDVGQSVGALRYVPEHCLGEDPRSHVITLLFAFDSTMKTPEREHERWRRLQLDRPRTRVARVVDNAGNWVAHLLPPLFVACVVGRGYGYYDALHGEGSFGWLSDMPSPNYEVLNCMAGIGNTLLAATHRPGLPFGRYFVGT